MEHLEFAEYEDTSVMMVRVGLCVECVACSAYYQNCHVLYHRCYGFSALCDAFFSRSPIGYDSGVFSSCYTLTEAEGIENAHSHCGVNPLLRHPVVYE